MSEIFISWRRSDSPDVTGRIHDYLVNRLGTQAVFRDLDKIPLGADFREELVARLRNCKVLLAVVGPGWLGESESGQARLESSDDWVRAEILTAIELKIPVVPVYVGGVEPPSEHDLPEEMKNFPSLQAHRVRPDPDFKTDVAQLVSRLQSQFPSITRAIRGSSRHAFDEFSFSIWNWFADESTTSNEYEEPGTRIVEAVVGGIILILVMSAAATVLFSLQTGQESQRFESYSMVFSIVCLLIGMIATVFGYLRSELLELLTGVAGIVIFFSEGLWVRIPALLFIITASIAKLGPIVRREIERRARELGRR